MKRVSSYIQNRPLVILHIAGWMIYVAADYADHALFGNYDPVPTLVCGFAAYVLTGLAAMLYARMQGLGAWVKGLIFAAVLYGFTLIWHKILIIFHNETNIATEWQAVRDMGPADWIATGFMPVLLFLTWAGFYLMARQYIARQEEQVRLRRQEMATRNAQLQTLRHQLNPHFLFNILNSIDVSVQSGDKDTAHKMTQHLSRFLRTSLEQGEEDKVPLSQELAMLRDFVAIEELRFKDKLRVSFEVAAEAEQALVPAMLFQPLMENAVKFAWSERTEGFITFTATVQKAAIVVTLENSKADKGGRDGTGTGLVNTRERLAILYGQDADVTVSDSDTSFIVTVRLPREMPA